MAKKEYDTFCDNPDTLPEGDTVIVVRELTPDDRRQKYFTKYIKARISRDPKKYPDTLYLRWQRGIKNPQPWSIEVLEEVGEYLAKK